MAGADRNASDAGAGGGGERERRAAGSRPLRREIIERREGRLAERAVARARRRKRPRRKNTARAARRRRRGCRSRDGASEVVPEDVASALAGGSLASERGAYGRRRAVHARVTNGPKRREAPGRAPARGAASARARGIEISAPRSRRFAAETTRTRDACPRRDCRRARRARRVPRGARAVRRRVRRLRRGFARPGLASARGHVSRASVHATPRGGGSGARAPPQRRRGASRWPGVRQARDGALRGQRKAGKPFRAASRASGPAAARSASPAFGVDSVSNASFETTPPRQRPHFFRPPRSLSESVTSDPPARL